MSIHSNFYSPTPLNEDQLRELVPSIFTTAARPDKSERFRPVPTIAAVRALQDEGYQVYGGGEALTRKRFNKPFVKHMLKFRQPGTGYTKVGDTSLEVVLVNANNGTASYRLEAGVFRLACLNGMIVKSKDFGGFTVRHIGEDITERVVLGSRAIAGQAERIMDAPVRWSKIKVSPFHQLALATRAKELRFGPKEERIQPGQLLQVRRREDSGNDLWSIFNVVQENITAGGLHGGFTSAALPVLRTRATRGIDENLRLNRTLWSYAEELAEELA